MQAKRVGYAGTFLGERREYVTPAACENLLKDFKELLNFVVGGAIVRWGRHNLT